LTTNPTSQNKHVPTTPTNRPDAIACPGESHREAGKGSGGVWVEPEGEGDDEGDGEDDVIVMVVPVPMSVLMFGSSASSALGSARRLTFVVMAAGRVVSP
jgi:hypothetical protein